METVAAFSPSALTLLRRQLGLTQTELANLAALSKAGVVRLEKGTVGLSPARLARIASALRVRTSALLEPDTPITLAAVRQEYGYGRLEMAEVAGISYQRLRRIESYQVPLPLEAAERMTAVLPFLAEQLVRFAQDPYWTTPFFRHREGTEVVLRWRTGQIQAAVDHFHPAPDDPGHPNLITHLIGLDPIMLPWIEDGRFLLNPRQALRLSTAYPWPNQAARLEHFYGTNLHPAALRQAAGFERTELAPQLNLTVAELYRLETGDRPLPGHLEAQLAELLDLDVEILREAFSNHTQ